MTDNTSNEGLWLPNDIASSLDNAYLARFRLLCSAIQLAGSDTCILQPLYNRLYALDNTLPAMLPQEDALVFFKKACEKIQTRQQFEMTYLKEHHPVIMAKPEYVQVFQENTTVSLQSLETINASLDKINSEIITKKINITRAVLNLNRLNITRLPVSLLQNPDYTHFWQNLTHLYCDNNQLTALNLQSLAALQKLDCNNNQLSILNVQGLAALQELGCNNNQLTVLDVQGLVALQVLDCSKNQLATLNVQGLIALQSLWCFKNQLTVLDVQVLVTLQFLRCFKNQLTLLDVRDLVALKVLDCGNNQLTTLNVHGLVALQVLDCDNNPLNTLILSGVHSNTKNKYAELERTLLFNKLSQTKSPQARQAIISRLGSDYTPENCRKYCPIYAEKFFPSDPVNSALRFASSALAKASAFLPSFATTNAELKRKRDEDEVDREELSEEPDNQPALKKRKRK